jgi:hypothetical protein
VRLLRWVKAGRTADACGVRVKAGA